MSVQDDVKLYDTLCSGRSTWENHWQEIAERVIPRMSNSFTTPGQSRTSGEKRTSKMFDATAGLGLERFAAAMESMLTPRNSQWHRLTASNPAINKDREARLWFEQATTVLFKTRYAPRANFASQQHENYMGLGAFGTAAMFIDAADKPGLRYRSIHLSEIVFDVNHQGVIDTAIRKFVMTARQIQQRVDSGRFTTLPDQVKKALEKGNVMEEFDILHVVKPNTDLDPTRADFRGMDFTSRYIFKKTSEQLSQGGYANFPYAISRYVTAPGEVYGRSPAMFALPAIKVINEQKKTLLKQGHRTVDPVLLSHDDGVVDSFSMKPGAMNRGGVSKEGRPLIQALPTGSLAAGQELMDMERTVINDAFLVTLFQILVETPAMTATEVLERAREKGALLSPTMGRQQSEALGPMIERELDLLMKQGLLPEMPPILLEAEGEYEVEYDSPLSRSQKAEEAAGLFRAIEFATAHANVTQDPSAFDWINIDVAMPQIMDINAVPASWQRGMDEIEAMREGRNQQQQTQQLIDAAPAAAGILKVAGDG